MHRQTHPRKQDRKLIDMCFISLHWRHYLARVKNIHIALFFQWKLKCMIQLLTKLNNNAKVKTEYLGQYNLYHFFGEGGRAILLENLQVIFLHRTNSSFI